jgi:enoyl-CoA hydratase/carnithine racemase
MTTELTSAWTVAMDEVTGDRSLRAVVVTGAGSAFCSGADLSWLDQGDPLTKAGLAQGSRGGFEVALQWEALAQPVTMATADIHEGIRARREHRPAAFEGS